MADTGGSRRPPIGRDLTPGGPVPAARPYWRDATPGSISSVSVPVAPPPPPPPRGLQRWLPKSPASRRALYVGTFLVVLAVLLIARVLYVRSNFLKVAGDAMRGSVSLSTGLIDGWLDAHRKQVMLVASVVAQEPAMLDARLPVAERRRVEAKLEAVLRSLVHDEHFAGAFVLTASGKPLVEVRAPGSPSVTPDVGVGAASLTPATNGANGFRTRTVGDASGVYVDLIAPVGAMKSDSAARPVAVPLADAIEANEAAAFVVLRAAPARDPFGNLNPVGRDNRTSRTSVVARIGDSLVVVTTMSNEPPRTPARAFEWSSAAPHARLAVAGSSTRGNGAGLYGTSVVYAAAPLKALGWGVVREKDVSELLQQTTIPLAIEETLFATLFTLLMVVIASRYRAARLRREHELTQLRTDFVSGVSHELRTPLAQIRMFAELLRKNALRDQSEADRALRIIEKEARRLTILVDNVLNFARLRRRTQASESMVTEIVGDVRQVIESFNPLAAERGVLVRAAIEQDALYALVDSQALRQILLNFLENAVKYGPRGQSVLVGAGEFEETVRIWVDDEGPGIAAADRDSVWKPFHRLESTAQSGEGGSGIGLAVVRDLVVQHNGRVWVEDAPLGGARFVVEIPAATDTDRAERYGTGRGS
jgi:signal transduction histidine kinase